MGKYSRLIDSLNATGKHNPVVYRVLIRADGRAIRPLVRALLEHCDEEVRHEIAHVLAERGDPKAIPFLIEAMADPDLYVRQDSAWAIEKICRMQSGALYDWLDLEADPDVAQAGIAENKRKVEVWWKANKRFLEHNELLR